MKFQEIFKNNFLEAMVMMYLPEVQEMNSLVEVQVQTQLSTFRQVLIQRHGIASDYDISEIECLSHIS
jgi:hypothetical protein